MAQKTISIDQELHARAVKHAKTVHYTDFSGLVTKLILADIQGSEAAALERAKTIRGHRTSRSNAA